MSSKPFRPTELPEDVARFAEAQVAAGHFDSVADVLRAGVEALARDDASADAEVWRGYQARGPVTDPRDLSASEALACLDSDDPEKQRVLTAHLDSLRDDVLAGKGVSDTPAEMMAGIRARLNVPPIS